ncbi:MAG: VOC family protein [Chloroflexota bacterium]|nr:MAG: VOC family protein [Chloroflexota bacterium]
MLLGLDHLVIAVEDPDAAAAELETTVGLACTGGGRHPAWGTCNRLAWLGDTYIELIGLFDRSLAPSGAVSRTVLEALDAGHAGLVAYAVASDDLDADVARLRDGGSPLSDVEVRSRTRPDGEVVRWRATFPPELGPSEPPFVIEHELVGAEWGDEARAERADLAHPLGGPARIVAIELPVPDIEAAADAYAGTVGIHFADAGPRGATATVGPQVVRLRRGAPLRNPAVVEIEPLGFAPARAAVEVDAVGVRWRIGAPRPTVT